MARRSGDIYDETLDVFDRSEPLTTPEVADALDVNRRTVYKRLQKLVDRGDLETKETGANSRVWWRVPDGPPETDKSGERRHEAALRAARRVNEELVENGPFGMFRLDEQLRVTYENPRAQEIIGLPEEAESSAAIGVDIRELPSIIETGKVDVFTRLTEGETIEFEFPFESIYGKEAYFTGRGVPLYRDGEFDGAVLMANDISERRQRERELSAARRFNEELVENAPFGMFRLDEELRITYENPRAREIIGLPDEMESSAAIGVDIRELPPIIETGQAELFTRLTDGETIEFEFPFESIYGKEAYFTGRSVPLYRDGEFDGAVLMANDISERRQRERELERQREQLAAVNEVNDVVRGVTEAVIDQSTREEIEQAVCERLSESGSYQSAWICAVDAKFQLEPRVGDEIGDYLDELVVCGESPDDGPVETAVHTHEVQVVRDGLGQLEPWGECAEKNGFNSLAILPIVHRDTLYGVLGVWSERPDAFTEEERDVVGQLGEVVGHAIAAVNRKRALISDEVTELTIRVPKLLQSEKLPETADGAITVERTVPLSEDDYLLFGTADTGAMEVVDALSERLPSGKSLRRIDEIDGKTQFEQQLSDPPIPSVVADLGGYFERGRIEDGEYVATIHLPPGTDARRVLTEIREAYPSAECLSQQQRTREEPSPQELLSVLTEELTGRQRAALEAGYYAGFFDWPRESSGEEVADSLDVGASTFHQHVRKAQKKLLDRVFDAG